MKTSIIYGAMLLSLAVGCSKKDDGTPTPTVTTKTDLLTKKDWIMTSSQAQQSGTTTWTDNYAQMGACDKDDHLVFRTDGTYESNEGATKCNPVDPFIVQTGTWKFAQNETIITLVIGTGSSAKNRDAAITTLDANTFSYSYSQLSGGFVYTIKESYGH